MNDMVIDADGHVVESIKGILDFLEPRWHRPLLFPTDAWDRRLGGTLGQEPETPRDHLAAMDQDGIDVMVIYPTRSLRIGSIHELEYTAALARACNDWLHAFCQTDERRLKFAAVIAAQDVPSAVEELRRGVTELGAVSVFVPTSLPLRPDWGERHYDAIYAEAQRLDVPIAFHTGTAHDSIGALRFTKFVTAHTVDHPVEQLMALCSTVIGGVFERFPQLRVGFLEAGIGWVPYIMDRLDEEIEKRGAAEAPYLTREPSEYIAGGSIFFGVECGEKTVPDAVRWGLAETLLYSSDYPHWDGDWPGTVAKVRGRTDLSDEVKRKMLGDNAARFYGSRLTAGMAEPAAAASR